MRSYFSLILTYILFVIARSRASSAYTGRVLGYPSLGTSGSTSRMSESAAAAHAAAHAARRGQINIIPNPCIDFSNAQRSNRHPSGLASGVSMQVIKQNKIMNLNH